MPTPHPAKARVVEALRARVAADLLAATRSQERAAEGATHEEARPEHDKDTRATEASYLARGLARRVVELQEVASALQRPLYDRVFGPDDPIAMGALVTIEDADGRVAHVLLAPRGGGFDVTVDGSVVRIVTPESPLGGELIGRELDDTVVTRSPRGDRAWTVVALS